MSSTRIRDVFPHAGHGPVATGAKELARDLRELGLGRGDVVMAHSSMRAVRGPGIPRRVTGNLLAAFRAVLGREGTLVVPAYTQGNSVTSDVFAAATAGMSAKELVRYLDRHPAFDPSAPVPSEMGGFAESVRTVEGALRSDHPVTSVVALGARAEAITRDHGTSHFGERSPLARLYDLDAKVLAIGVGWGNVSAPHLAESRRADRSERMYTCKVAMAGRGSWLSFRDVDLSDHDFADIGADFVTRHPDAVARGRVGAARCLLLPIRRYVDFAVAWMNVHRAPSPAVGGERSRAT